MTARARRSDTQSIYLRVADELERAMSTRKAGRPIEGTTSWLRADMFRIVFTLERQRA